MSTVVVPTSAALGRPFLFEDDDAPGVSILSTAPKQQSAADWVLQSAINNQNSKIPPASITPASRLEIRPAPEMVTSGIAVLDALTGGLPRGCLTELYGPASSGRTSVMLAALAAATRRGEYCALIDASDTLDPQSIAAAGIDLDRLLWVRCGDENSPQRHRGTERNGKKEEMQKSEHHLEQVLRATDLLLESGGFGLIVLDLADLPPQAARRIPLTTWFRFRRAVENKPTILLTIEQQPIAGSCSSLLLQLASAKNDIGRGNELSDEQAAKQRKNAAHGVSRGLNAEEDQAPKGRKKICAGDAPDPSPSHAYLLTGLAINVELTRSRIERKPAQSVIFETKTAWAG